MRQISVRTLRANLKQEMKSLPFEIIRSGQVVSVMCTRNDYECVHGIPENVTSQAKSVHNSPKAIPKSTDKPKSVHNVVKSTNKQLADIVEKKQKVLATKATIPMATTPVYGYSKNKQTGKK